MATTRRRPRAAQGRASDYLCAERGRRGHAERAAINTPLQGGAADVVVCALLRLWRSPTVRKLKWFMVAQVHDEVIMEGPIGTQVEAVQHIIDLMQDPLGGGVCPYYLDKEHELYGGQLRVDLPVSPPLGGIGHGKVPHRAVLSEGPAGRGAESVADQLGRVISHGQARWQPRRLFLPSWPCSRPPASPRLP